MLLTEGFWYKRWGGGHGADKEYVQDWARNWSRAVGIVVEECHRVNPTIEILPWEYNIDFRPQNTDLKRYFIQQLPLDTIPLLIENRSSRSCFFCFETSIDFSMAGHPTLKCARKVSTDDGMQSTELQIIEVANLALLYNDSQQRH